MLCSLPICSNQVCRSLVCSNLTWPSLECHRTQVCNSPECSNLVYSSQVCTLRYHQAGECLLKHKFLSSSQSLLRGLRLRIACSWIAKTPQVPVNSLISLEFLSIYPTRRQNHGQLLKLNQWDKLLSSNLLSHPKPQTTSSIKVRCAIQLCLGSRLMLLALLAPDRQRK